MEKSSGASGNQDSGDLCLFIEIPRTFQKWSDGLLFPADCLLYTSIKKLKVVYSQEKPMTPIDDMAISCKSHCICPPGTERKCTQRRQVPGSNAFVPSVVGLIIAGEVVKDLIK